MKSKFIKILAACLLASMSLSLFACVGGTQEDAPGDSSSTDGSSAIEDESIPPEESSSVSNPTESAPETEGSEKGDVNEETTEDKKEEPVVEMVYGYDFADNSWSSLFDMAGGSTRDVVLDPAGSGEVVLAVTHSASQSASWIRNKNAFENTTTGKLTISVDLYIPSDALSAAGDYVQMQINGAYDHHCNLVSDAKSGLNAFDTKDFPRDKWFKVQFVFDMDSLRYDVIVVEDGQERTKIFASRSAASLQETGPLTLRVYLGGSDQTIYVDHMGLVTTKTGEIAPEIKVETGVSFLRIDGVNAAGQKLSIYGDFSGDASFDDLTNISWERSNTYSGTYSAVSGANGLDYTPSSGGYYLRAKAKYGAKTLISYPVYVRESAEAGFFEPYLSVDGESVTAAVVYNNEMSSAVAELQVDIYDGGRVSSTFTESFIVKEGSDLVIFTFNAKSAAGKKVVLTVKSGADTLCTTDSLASKPLAKVQKSSNGSSIYIGDDLIADFSKNRYMRFRATVANDHWVGTEHNPIDMGFAYQESTVAGLLNTAVDFVSAPGVFKIVFTGQKAGLNAEQINELIGFWNEERGEFSYIYNCSITADTATWHENSTWAASSRIEAFDYCLERMSILDRVYNNNLNGDLYDYVIYENGSELTRIPKLPVPRTMLNGKYFYGFFISPGESFYLSDAKEGGWRSTLLSAIGDTYIEICWSWYDIHNCAENSVPRVGNCDEFTVTQSWLYTTTTAEHDSALIDNAIEVEWEDLPNYQLPLFSTNNTFETQFGGTDWQYAWWKSSYDCTMDATVGHSGAGSVKIEKTSSGEASWYTEGVWGFPYSFDQVQGKTYRVSGYIKTENVVGEAYIANIQYQHATPNDNTVTRSQGVSGTTDWTFVTFTFVAQERDKGDGSVQRCIDHFFLTLNGTGTVWFDDVVIEEVK